MLPSAPITSVLTLVLTSVDVHMCRCSVRQHQSRRNRGLKEIPTDTSPVGVEKGDLCCEVKQRGRFTTQQKHREGSQATCGPKRKNLTRTDSCISLCYGSLKDPVCKAAICFYCYYYYYCSVGVKFGVGIRKTALWQKYPII